MTTETTHNILLVEDTAALLELYKTALEDRGYNVTAAASGLAMAEALETMTPDILIVDLKLPDMEGMSVLKAIKQHKLTAPVIVITGQGSINIAVEAMRQGAQNFLVKPFPVDRLYEAVESELAKNAGASMPEELAGIAGELTDQHDTGRIEIERRPDFGGFIGTSPVMQQIYKQIENAAKSNATVFITGESGTGKEVCAEAIHRYSPRAEKAFIAINCAAIPRDLMESELFGHVKGAFTGAISDRDGAAKLADGGTLFLDEIAEMQPDMQTKLLRFIQDLTFRKVGGSKLEKTNVRIICATNRSPLDEIKAGKFREDLFYRLHVLPLYMPPLHARGNDIIDIAHTLLRRYAAEENKSFSDFTEDAEYVLRTYSWPGNIRQLQNVIRNIVVMQDAFLVTAEMISPNLMHGRREQTIQQPLRGTGNVTRLPNRSAAIKPLAEIEREVIEKAIEQCGGNIPKAAAALEVSPSTIYRKKAVWDEDGEAGGSISS